MEARVVTGAGDWPEIRRARVVEVAGAAGAKEMEKAQESERVEQVR